AGIISELGVRAERRKLTGLQPLRVAYTDRAGQPGTVEVVAKMKPLDEEVLVETGKLASLCGARVAQAWSRWGELTELKDSHTRELAVYRSGEPALAAVRPHCYGVVEDPAREAYVIVMERLGPGVRCLDAADDPAPWTPDAVDAALHGIAGVHGRWYGREDELLSAGWLGYVPGPGQV